MRTMVLSMERQCLSVFCLSLAWVSTAVSGAAETQPAAPQWGTSKAGVQISLSVPDQLRTGGKFEVHVAVRNVGSAAVALPAAKDVFGWLLLLYDRDNAYVTGKVFPAADLGPGKWPDKLDGGGAIRFEPTDMSAVNAYSYDKRRAVYTAYLKPESGAALPAPDGKLAGKLSPGKARARFTLYVPRPDEQPLMLSSNVIDVEIAPPDFSKLPPDAQKEFAARLLDKFD
ncbi:MAG: hypothetical protein WBF17_23185, partial [Phycisphaerae bacterium]